MILYPKLVSTGFHTASLSVGRAGKILHALRSELYLGGTTPSVFSKGPAAPSYISIYISEKCEQCCITYWSVSVHAPLQLDTQVSARIIRRALGSPKVRGTRVPGPPSDKKSAYVFRIVHLH